jgi:hypothetical protein
MAARLSRENFGVDKSFRRRNRILVFGGKEIAIFHDDGLGEDTSYQMSSQCSIQSYFKLGWW